MTAYCRREEEMDDNAIVELYWQRNDRAISETAEKYGAYCMKISFNILHDPYDSEENVNDTYMHAWNSIPPNRPRSMTAFLGRITRNLALNKYKASLSKKRRPGEFSISLDELSSCIPSGFSVEDTVITSELGALISSFLHLQKPDARNIFVCRYFYFDSVEDIAAHFGYSKSKVKSMLMRTRDKLRIYLEKGGYSSEK